VASVTVISNCFNTTFSKVGKIIHYGRRFRAKMAIKWATLKHGIQNPESGIIEIENDDRKKLT